MWTTPIEDRLNELSVGDKVAIFNGSYTDTTMETVEKVTKTQITINGNRYLKSSGNLYGSGIHQDHSIDTTGGMGMVEPIRLSTSEDVKRHNKHMRDIREAGRLFTLLKDAFSYQSKHGFSLEQLKDMVDYLELDSE